jgi:hypothetical protein
MMMQGDPLRLALWAGAIGLAVTIACALWIVIENAGSRNLALGLGALFGACVILLVQIFFELQGSTTNEDFSVEVTTDYQTNSVHSRPFGLYNKNLFLDAEASKLLAQRSSPVTKDDAPAVTRDLAIASIVSFLAEEQSDWQLDAAVYKTASGVITTWQGLSTPGECTSFTVDQLRAKLTAAGNMFGPVAITFPNIKFCLPPNSNIDVTANAVVITTRICQISITLKEPFAQMSTGDPAQPNVASGPMLANGQPRYVNVVMGGRATVRYFGLRAQARDLAKYQGWAKRIVDGIKVRFVNV